MATRSEDQLPADLQAELRAAKAFRPNSRPIVLAAAANVLLAALCLGVPYYRGHVQAQHSLRAFTKFAACLLGAEPGRELALGMPRGDDDHFAAQVMRAGTDWPARCKPALHAVAPEEAIFLWPSAKQTGADVRALVRLVEGELDALARSRASGHAGRVPVRPLLALSRLRAGLTLFARAANADAELDNDAVRFTRPPALVPPARLPLVAGTTATLEVWAGIDGLSALAMDGRGVSWLRVADGKVDRHRVRRTSLVRAALRAGDRPLLVWAMPESRCAEQEDRCVRHASGVALLGKEDYVLPKPTWLGGHPGARPDRSVRPGLGGRLDLLARADREGALEVRRFELPQDAPSAGEAAALPGAEPETPEPAPARPLSPTERYALPSAQPPSTAALLAGLPRAVAYLLPAQDGGQQALLWSYEQGGAPRVLGSVPGKDAWVQPCEADGARFIAFGTRSQLALAYVSPDGTLSQALAPREMQLGAPIDAEDPGHDRVRMLCHQDRATLLVAGARGTLSLLRCEPSGCSEPRELAQGVASFDAAEQKDVTLVAYARATHPEITLLRLGANGAPLAAAETPAACWDPRGGMCGKPTLAVDSGRLLLCARDGSDLLAIESNDGGAHWMPMSGLQISQPGNTDTHAPMDQHRLRKGLD